MIDEDRLARVARRVERIGGSVLILGDAREVLPCLSGVDCLLTDPPYSSGGAMRSDRAMGTGKKYQLTGTEKSYFEFEGDNRDQRSLTLWCSDWLAQCCAAMKTGGAAFAFIDWRNLPCMADAFQVGGFVYRGIVPWDKTEGSRPNKGWFRAQCEYIVCGSKGPLAQGAAAGAGVCQAGYLRAPVPSDKLHVTEKPQRILTDVLLTQPAWETVGVAALRLGRRFIGVEINPDIFGVAVEHIREAARQPDMLAGEA